MTVQQFEETIQQNQPSFNMSVYLQSLWYNAAGDWDKAHQLVDSLSGKTAAAVHAYLHRVEGDNGNANYWYNRAGKKMPSVSLQEEWRDLVEELLQQE